MPTKQPNNKFTEHLLGAAGGAILAGSLGVWIFNMLQVYLPNEIIAMIVGGVGGAIAIIQRHWEKNND